MSLPVPQSDIINSGNIAAAQTSIETRMVRYKFVIVYLKVIIIKKIK